MRSIPLVCIAVLFLPLVTALCPNGSMYALIIHGSENKQEWKAQNDLLRVLLINGYASDHIFTLSTIPFPVKQQVRSPSFDSFHATMHVLATTLTCADEILIDIAADAQYSLSLDWCVMLNNTCITAKELAALLDQLPACTKKLIASTHSAGALADVLSKDVELYAAAPRAQPATIEFHQTFINALSRTHLNFVDAFGQTKAFMLKHSKTIPELHFAKSKCICQCPQAPPSLTTKNKTNTTPQSPPILPPPQTTSVREPPIIKPAPKSRAIFIKAYHEPAIIHTLQETNCLSQCAKIAVAAPKTAVVFSSEIIAANTPRECQRKTGFDTILKKDPCMNYYLATREISKRIGYGSEFACCCRRIAREQKRNCIPQFFLGWTEDGHGVMQGERDAVVYPYKY